MIIAPGVEQPSVAALVELTRTDGLRRVDVTIQDAAGNPTDILEEMTTGGTEGKGELDLEVTDLSGTSIYTETYWPKPVPDTRRIRHAGTGTGKYYLKFGTEADETEDVAVRLFNWHARVNETSEDIYRTQVLEVVSPKVLSLLPAFRMLIDKTLKPVLPEELCFLGYTDGQLIVCLKLGLADINSYEPYPTFRTLDDFPIEYYSAILIKAALYQGITSQVLFAIDTDVPSYSDQGHSFVITHYGPLQTFLSNLRAELDNRIPKFKLKFVSGGSVGMEVSMNSLAYLTFSSLPTGSLWRNFYSNV